LDQLDSTLKYLYNTRIEFIICGDLNVDLCKSSSFKLLLSCLLQLYNLYYIVDFPSRFNKTSCSTVDNIFIDNSRHNMFKVFPITNDFSDHDVQYFILNNVFLNKSYNLISNKRLITKASISNFVTVLKAESWRAVWSHHDDNKSFSSFLSSFLMHFESYFLMHHTTIK
jgi:hypothetical protein